MKEYKELIPEITLKFKKQAGVHRAQIRKSRDAYDMFLKFFDEDTIELCESCVVLFLDNRNNSIGWFKVSQGGLTETTVDIRLILATALKCASVSIMMAHNHPAGGTIPSNCDDKITQKLKQGCDILGLQLLDHVIVADSDGSYYSYADEGKI
jgi:DNA repair protein RadC